jgi:hypothetical protein
MPRKRTTTRKPRTTTTPAVKKRPKLDTGGRPASKTGGKGGVVTQHGGTTTGYQRGCRCDECVAAMTTYKRKLRERKVEAAKPKATRRRKATR